MTHELDCALAAYVVVVLVISFTHIRYLHKQLRDKPPNKDK